MKKYLLATMIILTGFSAKADLYIDFVGNKVIIYQDGVKIEVEIDKNDILENNIHAMILRVCKKVKCKDYN